jgi:hypothetical protein
MEERGVLRIESGMEVYDRDNHKLGTVAHLHELAAPGGGGPPGARGYLEVATGLLSRLGLGRHLFVPLEAIRDVTEGGVFLSAGRDEADRADWHTRPAALQQRAEPAATVGDVSAPAADPQTVLALGDWAAAAPHYRRRWEQQHAEHVRRAGRRARGPWAGIQTPAGGGAGGGGAGTGTYSSGGRRRGGGPGGGDERQESPRDGRL